MPLYGQFVDQTGWTTYTPTITTQGGALTSATITATGRYKQDGKSVRLQVVVTVTNIGIGVPTGGIRATLPVTAAAAPFVGSSAEVALTGKSGAAFAPSGAGYVTASDATNTTYLVNGNTVVMSLVYEAA